MQGVLPLMYRECDPRCKNRTGRLSTQEDYLPSVCSAPSTHSPTCPFTKHDLLEEKCQFTGFGEKMILL